MHLNPRKLDRYAYEWATERHKDRIAFYREALDGFDTDNRKADRLTKGECRGCFYLQPSRIGGAAMSSADCPLCGDLIHSGSTNVNMLCKACAAERSLCTHCGGDMDCKVRRKVDLEFRKRTK